MTDLKSIESWKENLPIKLISCSVWLPSAVCSVVVLVDPDPHQCDELDPEPDPDPHQYADDKLKCMEYEPISAYFSRLRAFNWKL